MKTIKKYMSSIIMLCIFEAIAITLWLTKDNIFYLVNFSYIGASIALGLFLYTRKVENARRVVQFLVGTYMLIYLGLISNENMQIEGFWYYLFSGVFEAATIHYAVAKIFGPLVFGRGWCGYACWTAMILDLLPYKYPGSERKKIGWIRYVMFAASLIFVSSLFLMQIGNLERIMFWSFLIGNIAYYVIGIILAVRLRDNRAFCKYICPITIFLKPVSYFSLTRVTVEPDKCISCNRCKKVCPMNVDMTDNSRKRRNGTECILCMECIEKCPKKALKL
ncbi:MAG: 4Fe-4S dicluster domain-containing protein [Eubacteriales bacterium]|nr:4Fe-4S dicluster domain-containing protein [Eubacteriales bacterium]